MWAVSWTFVGLLVICTYHGTSSLGCLRNQFKCGDSTCLPLLQRCDKGRQCPDGTDEEDCTGDSPRRCPAGAWRCPSSQCIPELAVCDGYPNCNYTHMDEDQCWDIPENFNCLKNQFLCQPNSQMCIPRLWRCDRKKKWDCPNEGQDEQGCEAVPCRPGEHRCGNHRCLPPIMVCDGKKDCDDGSDEKDCDTCVEWGCSHYCVVGSDGPRCLCEKGYELSALDERTCIATCLRNQFRCSDDKQCVRLLHRCDGRVQCRDGSDEAGCKDFQCPEYTCGNGRCLPHSLVCDGWIDCDDASDEKKCAPSAGTCLESQFRCSNSSCIPLRWRCDGVRDCTDDESTCGKKMRCPGGYFRCKQKAQCISRMLACDGVADCEDGTDEENCGEWSHNSRETY